MFTFLKPRRKAATPPPAKRLHRIAGRTMGTEFRVTFAAYDPDLATLGQALFAAVDAVDQSMSTWKPNSALSQFNRAPLDEWFSVPASLAQVVAAGLRISQSTQGAFDSCACNMEIDFCHIDFANVTGKLVVDAIVQIDPAQNKCKTARVAVDVATLDQCIDTPCAIN